KRTGYSSGISFAPDWGEWQVLTLYEGVNTSLRPGMVFHIPPALRVYGKFTVGVSETALVTETGCEQLGTFPRSMAVLRASEQRTIKLCACQIWRKCATRHDPPEHGYLFAGDDTLTSPRSLTAIRGSR